MKHLPIYFRCSTTIAIVTIARAFTAEDLMHNVHLEGAHLFLFVRRLFNLWWRLLIFSLFSRVGYPIRFRWSAYRTVSLPMSLVTFDEQLGHLMVAIDDVLNFLDALFHLDFLRWLTLDIIVLQVVKQRCHKIGHRCEWYAIIVFILRRWKVVLFFAFFDHFCYNWWSTWIVSLIFDVFDWYYIVLCFLSSSRL